LWGTLSFKEVVLLYSLSTGKEWSIMWTSCVVWAKHFLIPL
jgi:hypothetical protein